MRHMQLHYKQTKEMELFQLNPPTMLVALVSLILLWSIKKAFLKSCAGKKIPPSPVKLPVIGNLHQLGSLPHRNLHSLSKKHGPLMLLHLGSVPVLIASSADIAREIMRTHDDIFASRPAYKVFKKLLYGCRDVAAAPYGEYWRKMKSILVVQLLTNKRVQTSRSIREEETALFVKRIEESESRPVDLSAMFGELSNAGIGKSVFGRKYGESENGKKFLLVLQEFMELLGSLPIGEFIPWLSWIDRVNGADERVDRVAKEMDEILESVIQEHMEVAQMGESSGENFLDILIEIYNGNNDDLSIDRDSIKPLLLDIFVGATDTTFTVLEWTMTELLRHPTVMEKLSREVRGIVQHKHDISDDDLQRMHYLQAVMKETFRLHPPLPLLTPRLARKDVQVKGYDVAAGTVVMINAWAIGRDPVSWDEPEEFKPDRFLNSSMNYNGQSFEFIPFGSGRRGCPGITFGVGTIELLLANLVQKFEWRLPDGVEGKDLDMNESAGVTAHRIVPLLALASLRN